MRQFLFCILLPLSIFSCKDTIKQVVVDNPTEQPITLQFDDDEAVTIPAGETWSMPVKFGKVELSINGDAPVALELDGEKDYLLNPAKENYYIENVVYFNSNRDKVNYDNKYGIQKSKVENFDVNGSYDKIEAQLLITKNWTFGLDKKPTRGGSTKSSKGYMEVKKIHRKKDIMKVISNEISKAFEGIFEESE